MSVRAEKSLKSAHQTLGAVGLFSACASVFPALMVMAPYGDMPPPPNPTLGALFWGWVVVGLAHGLVASQLERRRWHRVGLVVAVLSWVPALTVPPCLWPLSLFAGVRLWRALRNEGVTLLFERPLLDRPVVRPGFALACWSGLLIGAIYAGARVTTPSAEGSPVLGALETLVRAQRRFRQEDRERDDLHDYGTLAELSDTGLIDPALGSGTKYGYAFQVVVDPENPGLAWWVVATPLRPIPDVYPYLATNHTGVISSSPGPIEVGPWGKILNGEPLGE